MYYNYLPKEVMEQLIQDFSDSTPRAGSVRLQKIAESLISTLQLMSNSQISTQKYQIILTLFKLQENIV